MTVPTETASCICVCDAIQTEEQHVVVQKPTYYSYDEIVEMGGGLDGRRDHIVMNHSLSTGFFEEECDEHVEGINYIFKRLTKAQGYQICTTERDVYLGSFGIALKHPQIVASFDRDLASFRVDNGDKTFRSFNVQAKEYRAKGCKDLKTYKKTIKRNKKSSWRAYTESFVTFDMNKVSAFWIKEDYARQHPHTVLAIWEHAETLKKPCYIVRPNYDRADNQWVHVNTFVQKTISQGINSPGTSYEFAWYVYAAVYCRMKRGQNLMDALYAVKNIITDEFDYENFVTYFDYDAGIEELYKWANIDPKRFPSIF